MVRIGRLPIGIIIGIFISFFLAWSFYNWIDFSHMITTLQTSPSTGLYRWIGKAFSLDLNLIGFFSHMPSDFVGVIIGLFNGNMLAWIFTGGIAACITKGTKRGIAAALLVFVIDFLIWILFGILSGVDLLSIFSGEDLIIIFGIILGGTLGSLIGGFTFGFASGPYEELL